MGLGLGLELGLGFGLASRTCASIALSSALRPLVVSARPTTPPVSQTRKWVFSHSHRYSRRSRVVPALGETSAGWRNADQLASSLQSRFTSVDLPTFGVPTIASSGSWCLGAGGGSTSQSGMELSLLPLRGGSRGRRRPSAVVRTSMPGRARGG